VAPASEVNQSRRGAEQCFNFDQKLRWAATKPGSNQRRQANSHFSSAAPRIELLQV
jgi:hypothetical protein